MALEDSEIHVGDVGTSFVITLTDEDDAVVAIDPADEVLVIFQKPDQTRLEKTGSLVNDGSDGKFQYVSASGDLDQSGTWRIQGLFRRATNNDQWYTSIVKFRVYANL